MSVCTICTTTSTTCGMRVGRASAIPVMRDAIICIPASMICGSRSISAVTICRITSITTGSSSGIAPIMPSARAEMIAGALSNTAPAIVVIRVTTCGIIPVIEPITEDTPSLIFSPASSFPATRSERPSSIDVIPGRSSPTMRFLRPPIVPLSLVSESSNVADAATASFDMTMP